jgi:hypothetical protein
MKKYEVLLTRTGEVTYAAGQPSDLTEPELTGGWMDAPQENVYAALVNHTSEAEAVLMALQHAGLVRVNKVTEQTI